MQMLGLVHWDEINMGIFFRFILLYGQYVKTYSGLYKCNSPGHNKMVSYDVITYKANALKCAEDDYVW